MTYLGGKAICITALTALFSFSAPSFAQNSQTENISPDPTQLESPQSILNRSVVLRWTAPGDDGIYGRAAAYDLRYVPASSGPINTEAEWNRAIRVDGEPIPSPSGQADSMVVTGLTAGFRYYFCIKTCDEADNQSPLSNSPLIRVDTPEYSFGIGDVNNSGSVDGLDLILLVNALKGKGTIPMPDLRADVNGNCAINGLDVSYLRAYLSGGPGIFPGFCAQDPAQLSVRHLQIADGNN